MKTKGPTNLRILLDKEGVVLGDEQRLSQRNFHESQYYL